MPEAMQKQIETERHKKGASKAGQNYWVTACDVRWESGVHFLKYRSLTPLF